jgi:dUTP pyrophosphatase
VETYNTNKDGEITERETMNRDSSISAAIYVIKLHPDAQLPVNAHRGDAGYDLVAIDDGETVKDKDGNILYIQYKTGIAIQPPSNYHTEIFPRSSITKTHLVLGNSIGLVDSSYRGEIMVRFKVVKLTEHWQNSDGSTIGQYGEIEKYKKGDKIAQLVIRLTINMDFAWVEKLEDTTRGDGGFGSTDKRV